MSLLVVLLLWLLLSLGPLPGTARPAAGAPPTSWPEGRPVRYRPPVDAPVTDPFRLPSGPYGAGNRGVEYRTTPGTPVRAAADGLVTFAGVVAGGRHVTVAHADGIRTSYSFLATVLVRQGARVRAGAVLGRAGPLLHVGARRGTTYLDPQTLWGRGVPRVRLVPLHRSTSGPLGGGDYTRQSAWQRARPAPLPPGSIPGRLLGAAGPGFRQTVGEGTRS